MKRFMSRKVAVVGIAVGLTLGLSGAAFAYFTSTGSGSGSAATGSPTAWGVVASPSTGTMFPGVGTASVPFIITNPGSGNQALSFETPTVASFGGNVETTANTPGTAVAGCLASWYVPVNGTPSPANGTSIAPNGTVTDTITVTMTNAAVSQDACQGVSPAITLSVG
jgi:hypothetical protein